jgi:phenylalanyl-tRNA synthetase alpha chain
MSETPSLVDELKRLEVEALAAVSAARSAADLEAVRVEYLGRQDGKISRVLRGLGALPAEGRPAVGAEANRVKGVVQSALDRRTPELEGAAAGERTTLDLTLPPRRQWLGARHPVTRVVDEICGIFKEMGFTRVRGPEAETEWYNFVALNTPLDHPAADAQDTLYLEAGHGARGPRQAPGGGALQMLLRSHTSPVQIRTMETHAPPIRVIAPGWVYRRDTYDPTHTPAFLQVEGLAVDEGITFVDFKATLAEFARRFFGEGTEVRFRPSFFPFTEPSAEVDVKRVVTRPDGTRVETDWLEIMGAGMVDPAVLENVGYDPERYTGWAFGMGPARISLLRYGVPDLRMFFDSDMRFLAQLAESRP